MKNKWSSLMIATILMLGAISCYRPYGFRFYPGVPRFEPTDPVQVRLLRNEPRREHIQLGEVRLRPSPGMNRGYVEGLLREQAARMGADALVIVVDRYFRDRVVFSYWRGPGVVYERHIVGIAIRYRR